MAQFSRQVSRPLSAASYKAAIRHLRTRLDRIEARCEPVTARDKASLTSDRRAGALSSPPPKNAAGLVVDA